MFLDVVNITSPLCVLFYVFDASDSARITIKRVYQIEYIVVIRNGKPGTITTRTIVELESGSGKMVLRCPVAIVPDACVHE